MAFIRFVLLAALLGRSFGFIFESESYPNTLLNIFLNQPGNNVCETPSSRKDSYQTKCGTWGWSRCTAYKTVNFIDYNCCTGWQNFFKGENIDNLLNCNMAICDTRTHISGPVPCNKNYAPDVITYRTGVQQSWSGGRCTGPEKCTGCHDGFYSAGPWCKICPKIDNCHHRACSNVGNNICKYCYGEVVSKAFWRAYTPAVDGGKTCRLACSWRDNVHCYPGSCADETHAACKCVAGFTGGNCDQMTEKPSILYNEAKLEDGSSVVANPADPSADYTPPIAKKWTNNINVFYANTEFHGKYTISENPPNPDPTGDKHYITGWRSGIVSGYIKLILERGGSAVSSVMYNCPQATVQNPVATNYICKSELQIRKFGQLKHDDIIKFEVSATNGGYVNFMHREAGNAIRTYYLKGQTESRMFTYHFDTVAPYQTCVKSGQNNCAQPVTAPDLTTNAVIAFSWEAWADDLSGLKDYGYQVFELAQSSGFLTEDVGKLLPDLTKSNLPLSQSSDSFTLPEPGVYAIHFIANDNAGNHKVARKILLYDNISKVEKKAGKYSRIVTASSNTSYGWVIQDTNKVRVTWTDLFINIRHTNLRWLNAVRGYFGLDAAYDDKYGNRTTEKIDNIHGVIEFKVAFTVHQDNKTVRDSRSLSKVSNIHNQREDLTLTWEDGDRLDVVIRATDVLWVYDEESLTVYRDATPPVIENLWLTRGQRTDIYVHRIEDFTKMTIEWDAYDYHSGVNSIYWKLYDNFTQTVILHGHEDLISKQANDLGSCQSKYGSQPGQCYCTPFMNCFHKHFIKKPTINIMAGLKPGKDKGIHDYDYFIEVQVISKAKLVTTLIKKITVDVSPPHAGVVHDGIPGTLEVDFQQSKVLHAHWEGFFDRESGVMMYLYAFDTSCKSAADMVLDSGNPMIVETTSTVANHTVVSEGNYKVTVVAFNRALEPSEPVCSDGVTVDTTKHTVKEVSISGAKTKGGLVTNAAKTEFWIMGADRVRRKVDNVTNDCRTKATVAADLHMLPIERNKKDEVVLVDGNVFCANSSGAVHPDKLVIPRSNMLYLEWIPVVINSCVSVGKTMCASDVFDYETGLSSTKLGSASPDLLSYVSTKQHSHKVIKHADMPSGTEFYLHIKSISKSEVEGIQSIGPCYVDATKPDFSGEVSIALVSDHLVATWNANSFIDQDDFYDLTYSFAIGHKEYGTDVQPYQALRGGATCSLASPPTCTAALVADLEWYLHGHHTYYVTIKAENIVGLFTTATSKPYVHDVQLPSKGVVFDVTEQATADIPFLDAEDIDFRTDRTSLSARWSHFDHPHLGVTYKVSIGTTKGGSDILATESVGTNKFFKKTGLSLQNMKTYYVTVTAVSTAGPVSVTSDGVTIVTPNALLSGIKVYDGRPCSNMDERSAFKYHDEDNRIPCTNETDYQASLNSIQAYWSIPDNISNIARDFHFAIETRSPEGVFWSTSRDYEHIATGYRAEVHDLFLLPGRTYRVAVKVCAAETCFRPVHSDGVTVLSSKPKTGNMVITHTSSSNSETVSVDLDRFYDPDVVNSQERLDAIYKYEWAITDNSENGKVFTNWTTIQNAVVNSTRMNFQIRLLGDMDFSRCKVLSIRGYNHARLWSLISKEIKKCDAFDPLNIIPNLVIDAIGEAQINTDGTLKDRYGRDIYLKLNADWKKLDVDYTPYTNIISAVWPKLRHRNYTYAVLKADSVDITSYYKPTNRLSLRDPCSHPDKIACGNTKHEYVNVKFADNVLQPGKRYIVCIHADEVSVKRENFIETYNETSTCSDGVVIDVTSPAKGQVWINRVPGTLYQTTTSHMYVHWESFRDVEEFANNPHSSGIEYYTVGIGTSIGGNDIVPFTNIGITNYVAFNKLSLQNGHTYYVTLTATDFAKMSTTAKSEPIRIDVTPPTKTDKPITLAGRHVISTLEIEACWKGVFIDLESGINNYMWAVGSRPGYEDIMAFKDTGDVECTVAPADSNLDLHEGHAYFITVRAINGAKLYSQAVSWAMVVDLTPPIAGHVYDGRRSLATSDHKDIDFQSDTSYLAAYWEGFHDPHSTIKEYYIRVGTCKKCDDILGSQAIGITGDFELPKLHLAIGIVYYTTVTVCNTADLCTTVTSDGVMLDNTPPTPGVVMDGVDAFDIHYQADVNYIAAKWYGFSDPQSGLDHYEWWAGTSRGAFDVMPKAKLHLAEEATNPNVTNIPVGTKKDKKVIYITVRAYNKNGQFIDSSSNGFTIDTTPPDISEPMLSRDVGSVVENAIVYRSSFKVFWTAQDHESYIQSQTLSIKAHRGGEFKLASTKINGITRDYTFLDLDLHDGVKYYVTLTSCNGAGLCVTKESCAILMDSSPPTRGMFAIRTEHAANVQRHVPGNMTWTTRAVYLSWLGFADLHSGIHHYKIAVGKSYMSSDLLEGSDAISVVYHSSTAKSYSEGPVQTAKIETQDLTKASSNLIFISMWAVNKAGLESAIIHSAFKRISGGPLELVRRCTSYSCIGHCICAPQDKICPHAHMSPCKDTTINNPNTPIEISDLIDLRFASSDGASFTHSDMTISAKWLITQYKDDGLSPIWYEWSVGIGSSNEPEGLFDILNDRVWHDAGQKMYMVYTVPRDKQPLKNTVTYSVFIRVWYNHETFAVFKSKGISVYNLAPAASVIKGAAVTESIVNSGKKDMDFLTLPFDVDWTKKYVQADKYIEKYRLYLSTYPGGHDIYTVAKVFPTSITKYTLKRYSFSLRVKYYWNVVAYSYSGVHRTESSDGFEIDSEIPVSGAVYDGNELNDVQYQSSGTEIGASWHGFEDIASGIKEYYWCAGNTSLITECTCTNNSWIKLGLRTSITKPLTDSIKHGTTVYNKIYAIDGVDRRSDTIVSNGIKIDTTAPVSQTMVHEENTNLVSNFSFEQTGGNHIAWNVLNGTDICSKDRTYAPLDWDLSPGSCAALVSSDTNLAKNGRMMLMLRGQISQEIKDLKPGGFYRIKFYTSHLPVVDSTFANKEGFVEFGEKHIFMLYTKAYRKDEHGTSSRQPITWHLHTYYITAKTKTITLKIGDLNGKTGFLLDAVELHHVWLNETGTDTNVNTHLVFLHQWSSINAAWSFIEPDSHITEYFWAIGYTRGGTQVQGFESAGLRKFAYNNKLTLVHESKVYVTVVAKNTAGLRGISFSDPFLVDLTSPNISQVNDGTGEGSLDPDLDASLSNDIAVNWKVDDPESGVEFCEWAIGFQPFGNEMQSFTKMPEGVRKGQISDVDYNAVAGKTVYSTIRCQNKAGLQSSRSSDGIKISKLPPTTDKVILSIIGLSVTEYNSQPHYQSVTNQVRMKWTGFEDDIGIESFIFSSEQAGIDEMLILVQKQDYMYVRLDGLTIPDGGFNLTLSAKNLQYKESDAVYKNFTCMTKSPNKSGTKPTITWDKTTKKLTVSWDGIFTSPHPLYYEVSAGTVVAGGDIVQWQETTNTFVTFGLPKTVTDPSKLKVFVIVRAVAAGGHFLNEMASYTLPVDA